MSSDCCGMHIDETFCSLLPRNISTDFAAVRLATFQALLFNEAEKEENR